MAAFDTTRPFASAPMAGGTVTRFVARQFGRIAAWNDARMTRKSLSGLSLRELDDIGLVPGDIDDLAERTTRF